MVLFSASGTLGETKNRQPIRAAVFNPPAEIYLVSFPTTHRREPSFPIKGTLALPLPGCQTRIRVVPDVAWDRLITAAKGNNNLCHSENNRRNVNWITQSERFIRCVALCSSKVAVSFSSAPAMKRLLAVHYCMMHRAMGVHYRLVVRTLDQYASSGISVLYGKMCLHTLLSVGDQRRTVHVF